MDDNNEIRQYKPAKTVKEQTQYIHDNKRVQFNQIKEKEAQTILLRYNYVNVITPYKHHFAKIGDDYEVIKDNDDSHIYERDVEFSEYYDLYVSEREKYPIIAKNIFLFESQFKAILAYHVLTTNHLDDSEKLRFFIDTLRLRIPRDGWLSESRINRIVERLQALENQINKYYDIYCFFDRLTLGDVINVYICLPYPLQNNILADLKRFGVNLGADQVRAFVDTAFSLVAIRNCVMHSNSLEILIRFFEPKNKSLRTPRERRKLVKLIERLSKEKQPTL